jgi:hypothetical protein
MVGTPYTKEYLALGLPDNGECFASIAAMLEQSDQPHARRAEVESVDQISASLAASKEFQCSKNP